MDCQLTRSNCESLVQIPAAIEFQDRFRETRTDAISYICRQLRLQVMLQLLVQLTVAPHCLMLFDRDPLYSFRHFLCRGLIEKNAFGTPENWVRFLSTEIDVHQFLAFPRSSEWEFVPAPITFLYNYYNLFRDMNHILLLFIHYD